MERHDKIVIETLKVVNLSAIFGTYKTKVSGQKFKDLARKEWEKRS